MIIRSILLSIIFTLMIIFPSAQQSCHGEPHIIEATGTFDMGDDDSREHAKKKAMEDALRQITEQAGVYVESYSETSNAMLTRDEVRIIASSIVRVIDERFEFVTDDNWHCKAHVKAEANTDSLDLPAILQGMRHQNTVADIPQRSQGESSYHSGMTSPYRMINQNGQADVTGLIIDIRDLLGGEVFITGNNCFIVSEAGEVIYQGSGGSKWLVVHRNRSANPYFQAGRNPLKVKAVALERDSSGTYSSIVISAVDGNRIKEQAGQHNFLNPGKILIAVQ